MKKIILVFAAIAITAGAYAQTDSASIKKSMQNIGTTMDNMDQNMDMNNSQDQVVQNNPVNKTHPDGAMMQNGKMMTVRNGQMRVLEQDTTMSNGTKVMSDGSCIKKDGTKMKIKEGQHLDASGNMTPMKTNKDKTKYLGSDSTKNKNF